MQKIYSELKDKGLELVALNNGDDKETIDKYVAENKFTFKIGMGSQSGGEYDKISKAYGVSAYPTNYIVDSNGKVIWRGVGFDEIAIRGALAKIGLK